ncbi:MAG: hypothetical protein ACRYFY_16655, partial [Janthinobacterium lividum]
MRSTSTPAHAKQASAFRLALSCGAATLMIGLAFTASGAQAVDITGAGSTFAAPIYGAWGAAAKSPVG